MSTRQLRSPTEGPTERIGTPGRVALAVALGAAAELAGIGLLATGAWLLLDASLRPPILLLSSAIALVRFFALLRGGANFGQRLASHDVALRHQARLQLWIYRQLERSWPGEARRGELLAELVSDTDEIRDLLVRAAIPLAALESAQLAAAGVAAALLPAAGLAILLGGLGALVATGLSMLLASRARTRLQEARAAVSATVLDALGSAEELAALGATPWTFELLDEAESELGRASGRLARATGAARFAVGAIGSLTLLLATVLASKAAMADHLDGVALGVVGLVALGSAGLDATLPDVLGRVSVGREALGRLRALAAAPIAPADLGAAPTTTSGSATLVLEHAIVRWPSSGHAPPSARRSSLGLVLEPGRPVALLGPSGSGKTSLVLALLGLLPLEAERFVFGDLDLGALDPAARRALMAWSEEQPTVFSTTLRANLKIASADASDDELLDVLGTLGLGKWLRSLEVGLDTELGSFGKPVSGGERQRLGVARALLSRRPILLLDEPTAHLGPDDAERVQDAILAAARTRSVLWVTHRSADAERCAEVVTLPA